MRSFIEAIFNNYTKLYIKASTYHTNNHETTGYERRTKIKKIAFALLSN